MPERSATAFLADWDQAEPLLAAYAAEHEYGQWWQLTMTAVPRLVLAAGKAARALRILVAWLGADASFHEADVRDLAGLRPGVQVRRVLTFLAARDMLIPDPGRQAPPKVRQSRIGTPHLAFERDLYIVVTVEKSACHLNRLRAQTAGRKPGPGTKPGPGHAPHCGLT